MTQNLMLLLVPTRGRPENCVRLMNAVYRTACADMVNVDVLFCVDDDDPALAQYTRMILNHNLLIGSPARLGPWLNRVAPGQVSAYPVIGFMGDDHVPETPGWDERVLDALREAGPWGMAYGDDGYQGEKLPTAVFMRSELIRHLGWMVPPGLEHLYIDNAWKDIGTRSGGLRYLPDVKITHLHYVVGAAHEDATYKAGNSREQYTRDRLTYRRFIAGALRRLEFPETKS